MAHAYHAWASVSLTQQIPLVTRRKSVVWGSVCFEFRKHRHHASHLTGCCRLQMKKVQNLFQSCFDVSFCFVQPPIVARCLRLEHNRCWRLSQDDIQCCTAAAVYCMLRCVNVFRSTGLELTSRWLQFHQPAVEILNSRRKGPWDWSCSRATCPRSGAAREYVSQQLALNQVLPHFAARDLAKYCIRMNV